MDSRIKVLQERASLEKILEYHEDVVSSLRFYFNEALTVAGLRFLGYSEHAAAAITERFLGFTREQITAALAERMIETDLRSALAVLISLERVFRQDYKYRCENRLKDPLSKLFRSIYKAHKTRVSLDRDILEHWSKASMLARQLVGRLRGAFRFRHWLAHGHSWEPKLGMKYDFNTVYVLADVVLKNLPLQGRDI